MGVAQSRMIDDINGAFAIHFIADGAGGTVLIPSISLTKPARGQAKTYIQVKGTVTVSYSLSQTSIVTNDDAATAAAALWDGPTTLTPLSIQAVDKAFTFMKLVFAPGAEAHVAAN